jgi:hypothetical protein
VQNEAQGKSVNWVLTQEGAQHFAACRTRERLIVTTRVREKRAVKQPVSFLTGSLVLAEMRMVSCDGGTLQGQGKRSPLHGDGGTPHLTHLVEVETLKLFRVPRKLTPDEQMWLVLFLASARMVLVVCLLGKPH